MTTEHLLLSYMTFLWLFAGQQMPAQSTWYDSIQHDSIFKFVEEIRYTNPDSAIHILDQHLGAAFKNRDTTRAIQILLRRAHFTGHMANYKESYDHLWTALALAEKSNYAVAKAATCISLGRYYSYYKRQEDAFSYFDTSLSIKKRLVAENLLPRQLLTENYYVMAETWRILEEYDRAAIYLDSAYAFCCQDEKSVQRPYLDFERAILTKEAGHHQEALDIFESIQPWLMHNDPGYQVLLLTYMGDTYREQGDFAASESHYLQAIDTSEQYHAHIDFSPLIHEKLAALYADQNKISAALAQLRIAKALDANFFDSRSANNRPLMEIQDAFREEQERNQQLLQEQRLTKLEHQNQVWFLQRIILFVSLLFFLVLGYLYLKYIQSKHRTEKRLLRKERELEIRKANELVELKNKELATSTLKLIEKDELLVGLRDRLKNGKRDLRAQEIKQIVRTINTDTLQNWEEFETRFTAVNRDFYLRLKEAFPKLTQGDQKICALIKLNFSSKDMARLLGISVESVHTTRYRLRKKLDLSREVNLGEFISNI